MMREEMADACKERPVGAETICEGRVPLTEQHMIDAEGDTEIAKRNDILAEARMGCSLKCGCQNASAVFVKDPQHANRELVVASCGRSAATLTLGDKLKT